MEYHRLSSSGGQHIQELVKVSVQLHLLWANASHTKHKFAASLPLTLTQSHCSVVNKNTLTGASSLKFWICEGFYVKWRRGCFQHILRAQFSDVYFPRHRENHWNFEYHERYEWEVPSLSLSFCPRSYLKNIFFSFKILQVSFLQMILWTYIKKDLTWNLENFYAAGFQYLWNID